MIKKISAIVLALVLCLSVVVMPASALEDGQGALFSVELDKEYYSAGDTVTVKVFVEVADGKEWEASNIVIGMSSEVFNMDENAIDDIKASAVVNAAVESFYKAPTDTSWAWQENETILKNINDNNTTEEQAVYDQYVKLLFGKNANGSHENCRSTKNGLPSDELNAETDPYVTFELQVREDVADGTVINVGVPTGSIAKNYTYYKAFSNPGKATTKANVVSATAGYTTATIGAPELAIDEWKEQINFDLDGNGFYEGAFAIRQFVEFTNLLDVFGSADEAKDASDDNGLTEVGFVYATTADYDAKEAEAVIEAGASSGAYTLDNRAYVSTSAKSGSFVMGYTVKNVKDASVSLTILAYAKYMVDGEEKIATHEIVGNYSEIYNKNVSKIPPVKA